MGAVVAGLAAAAGGGPAALAAIACDAVPPAQIAVDAVPPSPTIDDALDLAALKERSRGNVVHGEQGQPLGLTVSKLVGTFDEVIDFAVDPRAPSPTICGAPREVRARVAFEDTVIYIAREATRDRCLYDQILQHENRHVQVNRELVVAFAPRIEANLRGAVARMGLVRGPNREAVWFDIRQRLRLTLEADLRALLQEMRKRQQLVDRPEEYRRLSDVCGGAARQLLAPASAPAR